MAELSVADIAARLNARIADLARALFGEPNHALSTKTQLRFGTKGSVAVEIDGPDTGKWFDHEAGVGGDGLELIRERRGVANGEACAWALEWLGLAIPTSLESRPKSNAEKVEEIVARSEGIAGTRVEAYLQRRGITVSPPDCIRFRRFAAGPHGALVALATDAAGAVLAVQQIYLTEDGRKAPVDVVKRTNKAVEDWSERAAMRLPGTPPIVLCEGVETALSVWQATGHETWACLGITNMARAPLWQPRREGERNEALDTTVYAMAALHGLISMGLQLNKEADALSASQHRGALAGATPVPAGPFEIIRSRWMK
jgi:hypothetical protein